VPGSTTWTDGEDDGADERADQVFGDEDPAHTA
jgi:hypothetical protein